MGERSAVLAFVARDAASGPIKQIDGALDKLHGTAGKVGGGLGKLGGAIVDVGKVAAGAALAGVVALGAGLVYATKQAAEEEKGVSRLGAALKANVKDFNGNTDAIEKLIAKRERLAFSDDELRTSLSRLVSVTKDVEKAQNLQAIAMDLARLKGIDLATASDLVGKVSAGNLGILGRYGIVLEKGATATEALAEIQKRAAGQAEAYGKTTAGAFETFKIKLDDVVENIGGALLPVATSLAQMMTDQVIPAVEKVAAQFTAWVEANRPLIDQIVGFVSGALAGLVTVIFEGIIPAAAKVAAAIGDWFKANRPLVDQITTFVSETLKKLVAFIRDEVVPKFSDLIGKVGDAVTSLTGPGSIGEAVGGLIDTLGRLVTKISTDVMDTLGRFKTDIETGATKAAGGLVDTLKTLVDKATEFTNWITNTAEIRQAFYASLLALVALKVEATFAAMAAKALELAAAIRTLNSAEVLGTLLGGFAKLVFLMGLIALNWDTFKKMFPDLARLMEDFRAAVQRAGEPIKAVWDGIKGAIGGVIGAIGTAIGKVQELIGLVSSFPTLSLPIPDIGSLINPPRRPPRRADGGPVSAGRAYLVGERGPELFVPRSSGAIVPNGAAGSPVVIQLTLDGRTVAEVVDAHLAYRYATAARTAAAGV